MSSGSFAITAAQIRAARGLVGISGADLASKANVGLATIRRAEASNDIPSTTKANLTAIKNVLEDAGVEFIPENGGGPGVRLKR